METHIILGITQSGKNVYLNKLAEHELYSNFTSQDHADASLLYNDRRVKYRLTYAAEDRSFEIEHSHNLLSIKPS